MLYFDHHFVLSRFTGYAKSNSPRRQQPSSGTQAYSKSAIIYASSSGLFEIVIEVVARLRGQGSPRPLRYAPNGETMALHLSGTTALIDD
jgi:hypothetical protein